MANDLSKKKHKSETNNANKIVKREKEEQKRIEVRMGNRNKQA